MGCCCDWRAPRQLRYVLPAIIIAIITGLYSSFTYYAQPLLSAAGVHWAELLSFHIMTALLCASLAQTLLSTDSFVKKNTLPRKQKEALDAMLNAEDTDERGVRVNFVAKALPDGTPPMVESKMNGEIRYCRKCRAVKPDRAHHCSTCRRCVLKMDHHCVYINKCVFIDAVWIACI